MKKIFGFALIASMLFSCSSDDNNSVTVPVPDSTGYSEGIFVVNEGNFGTPNASISWINEEVTEIKNELYITANQDKLGDVAQSLAFSDDLAFIVVNNSNVVEVVNIKDFKKVATITESLSNPRYAVVSNNFLYVTNSNKTVSIYNVNTFNLVKTISLPFTAELIVKNNNYVYAGSNPYNTTGSLAIISASSNELETTIQLSAPVKGLTTNSSNVYALTSKETTTNIETITNNAVAKVNTFQLGAANHLVADKNNFYFTSNLSIYEIGIDQLNQDVSPKELFKVEDNSWSSLYGFNVIDAKVFTADAKAFKEDSEITIYNLSGNVLTTFTAGMGANGFYKK